MRCHAAISITTQSIQWVYAFYVHVTDMFAADVRIENANSVFVDTFSIQFNSIYFKTLNIKKQAIQIQIISHMVRMKYN